MKLLIPDFEILIKLRGIFKRLPAPDYEMCTELEMVVRAEKDH